MKPLFAAEWRRFVAWGAGAALAHLLLLVFASRLVDLTLQQLVFYRVAGVVYALLGLLVGVYQMGGYRRPDHWLNLLHRPLSPPRIVLALSAAVGVWLVLVIAVPLLLVAAWQVTTTPLPVDQRHLLMIVAAVLLAACGYLAGACLALGERRYGWCALVLLALLPVSEASGAAALALQGLVLVCLYALLLVFFRPCRSRLPRGVLPVAVLALPLMMGLYIGLTTGLNLGYQMVLVALGASPNNTATPPAGGVYEANRMDGRAIVNAGLKDSPDSRAPLWREQVDLSDVQQLAPELRRLPRRGAMSNILPPAFDDSDTGVRWVFSHDAMRLVGYKLATRQRVGELPGVGAQDRPFPSPVIPLGAVPGGPRGDVLLMGRSVAYQYLAGAHEVEPRIRLPADEVFAGRPLVVGTSVALLGNKAVYFYDQNGMEDPHTLLKPRLRVALPGAIGNLTRVDFIELASGYLMSFTFTDGDFLGQAAPWQQVLDVHEDGTVEAVGRRAIHPDFPVWFVLQDWWWSPLLYHTRKGAMRLLAAPNPLAARVPVVMPRVSVVLAAVLAVLAALAAAWLGWRMRWSWPRWLIWIAVCAVIGVPALLALCLLHRALASRQVRPHAAPVAAG